MFIGFKLRNDNNPSIKINKLTIENPSQPVEIVPQPVPLVIKEQPIINQTTPLPQYGRSADSSISLSWGNKETLQKTIYEPKNYNYYPSKVAGYAEKADPIFKPFSSKTEPPPPPIVKDEGVNVTPSYASVSTSFTPKYEDRSVSTVPPPPPPPPPQNRLSLFDGVDSIVPPRTLTRAPVYKSEYPTFNYPGDNFHVIQRPLSNALTQHYKDYIPGPNNYVFNKEGDPIGTVDIIDNGRYMLVRNEDGSQSVRSLKEITNNYFYPKKDQNPFSNESTNQMFPNYY